MKLTFTNGIIILDGKKIGTIDGTSEVYVHFQLEGFQPQFVGRFKYRSPKTVAKYTIRELLKHRTPEDIVKFIALGRPAGQQLQDLSIPSYWATKLPKKI